MQAVVQARNHYNVKLFALIATPGHSNSQVYKQYVFNHSLEHDVYHNHLLRSKSNSATILGVFSLIHWVLQETPAVRDQITDTIKKKSENDIARIVKGCIALVDYSKYEQALRLACNLFDGRITLATTLLAFTDPENIGILNREIDAYIRTREFAELTGQQPDLILDSANPVSISQASHQFASYCRMLQSLQYKLNEAGCEWKDQSGSALPRLRSIDVQRALYFLALTYAER